MSTDRYGQCYPCVHTLIGAKLFMKKFGETEKAYTCVHGHFDCSIADGGPCMDETLSNFPEANDYC